MFVVGGALIVFQGRHGGTTPITGPSERQRELSKVRLAEEKENGKRRRE